MNKRFRHPHPILALFFGCCLWFILTGSRITDDYPFSDEDMKGIQQEVNKRVAAYVEKERSDCHTELMDAVDARVDTILMKDIRKLLLGDDSLAIPLPPPRPDAPEILRPKDDTPLQPLVNEKEWNQ